MPIIEVKNLSKKYKINPEGRTGYLALRDVLANAFAKPLGFFNRESKKGSFWALKNLSFKVEKGEVLGIIGPNGAGKTTILKILTRITPPTRGLITLRGSVASLLEVGTGFHPELTGRENVFLNGAILGMRRSEVLKKFDEIVEFSGVEKFLDTPMKHFSSGMEVRLAFSVAAHLESDILLVDEVLAVGDAEFQKRSLGKMESVNKEGRTILFVSHNLSAITALCSRAIFLKGGRIMTVGEPARVISQYLSKGQGIRADVDTSSMALSNNVATLTHVRVCDQTGKTSPSFDIRKPIRIEIEYLVKKPKVWIGGNVQLKNNSGLLIFNSAEDINQNWNDAPRVPGLYKSTCWIPGNFLAEGIFGVRVTITSFLGKDRVEIDLTDAVTFNVHDPLSGDSVRGKSTTGYPGIIRPKLKWERTKIDMLPKSR